MDKPASINTLTNYAPYAMMAYGNTLAAPSSFTHDDGGTPLTPKDVTKRRIRHLLKGITYTSAGYAATRALFNKDFDPEQSEFHTPGMWNSLKREAVEMAHHQGVPRFLLPKVKAASLSAEYLIKSALEQPKLEEPEKPSGWSIPGAFAATMPVNAGLFYANHALGKNLMSNMQEAPDPQFRSRLRKAMDAEHIPFVTGADDSMPFFSDRKVSGQAAHDAVSERVSFTQRKGTGRFTDFLKDRGFVSGPKNVVPDVLAHEYGHATGNRILQGLYGPSRRFAMGGGGFSAVGSGLLSNPDDSFTKSLGRGALHGSAIGLIGSSPLLAEELRATMRAMKGLRAAGATPQRLSQARGRLGSAFGTYLTSSLLNHTTSGMLGGVTGRYIKSRLKKPKVSSEPAPEPKK